MAKKVTKKTNTEVEAEVKTPVVDTVEEVQETVDETVKAEEVPVEAGADNAKAEDTEKGEPVEAEPVQETADDIQEKGEETGEQSPMETLLEKVQGLMSDEPTVKNIDEKIKKAETIEKEIEKRNDDIKHFYGKSFGDFWNGVNNGWNN